MTRIRDVKPVTWMFAALLVLVLAGLLQAGHYNARLSRTNDAWLASARCRAQVETQLVESLAARNGRLSERDRAELATWREWLQFFSLPRDAPRDERLAAYSKARAALDDYAHELEAGIERREEHPLPSARQIAACADDRLLEGRP